jgi:hypothetical protein
VSHPKQIPMRIETIVHVCGQQGGTPVAAFVQDKILQDEPCGRAIHNCFLRSIK